VVAAEVVACVTSWTRKHSRAEGTGTQGSWPAWGVVGEERSGGSQAGDSGQLALSRRLCWVAEGVVERVDLFRQIACVVCSAEVVLTTVLIGFRRRRERRIGWRRRSLVICFGLFVRGRVCITALAGHIRRMTVTKTLPDLLPLAVDESFFATSTWTTVSVNAG
jgi:hypothetical protein